jgi:hypothetical protein
VNDNLDVAAGNRLSGIHFASIFSVLGCTYPRDVDEVVEVETPPCMHCFFALLAFGYRCPRGCCPSSGVHVVAEGGFRLCINARLKLTQADRGGCAQATPGVKPEAHLPRRLLPGCRAGTFIS